MIYYSIYGNKMYRFEQNLLGVTKVQRLISSDDEYWTALEWLTERGLI